MNPENGLALLGSTGSIGLSTLELLREHPDLASVKILSAHTKLSKLLEQVQEFRPKYAFITGVRASAKDVSICREFGCELIDEKKEIIRYLGREDVSCVLLAITGAAGLVYGLESLKHGKKLAIANKEPLVIAGHLFARELKKGGGSIIPVDSEHSAIFQCLKGMGDRKDLEKIILTSSGGPFHGYTAEEFKGIKIEEALKHPTWDMGPKITIDSATMMNKALEVVEARALFPVEMSDIKVVIHRQSVVHSMVQFCDGSLLAQLGVTDMRFPIHYALGYPNREASVLPRLNLEELGSLTFEKVNPVLKQAIDLAMYCGHDEVLPILMNASNEVFVDAFLNHRASFLDVYALIRGVMDDLHSKFKKPESLEEVELIDRLARDKALEILKTKRER